MAELPRENKQDEEVLDAEEEIELRDQERRRTEEQELP